MDHLPIEQLEALEEHIKSPGLKLTTASGLSGEISNSHEVLTLLIGMAKKCIRYEEEIPDLLSKGYVMGWDNGHSWGKGDETGPDRDGLEISHILFDNFKQGN